MRTTLLSRRTGPALVLVTLALAACAGEIGGQGTGDDPGSGDDPGDDGDDPGGPDGGPGRADAGPGGGSDAGAPPGDDGPAVDRGDDFFGTPERFNRYYTDPTWSPTRTIYVSPQGGGNGASAATPTTLTAAVEQVSPGTMVKLAAGSYASTCVDLDDSQGGTYDAPVVFAGDLDGDGKPLATVSCCASGRQTCFNLEAANYVAIDGLELVGGRYGVRAVGAGFPANQHQRGVAVLRSFGRDQSHDPFFTGQSDWYVIEGVVATGAGSGDGHGIYLSNGSDWLIVRRNELYGNESSDFQINADPLYTCVEDGVAVTSVECDAVAGTHATGGRGATDFALVEGNFFHDGLAQGANFTSVRNSVVRNNVFAYYERHGVSFWQETTNPKLGSRDNRVVHNLFITDNTNHAVQFVNNSTGNLFAQNVLLGVMPGGATANPAALLMEVDGTVASNQYVRNAYVGGHIDGRSVGSDELQSTALDVSWFSGGAPLPSRGIDGFLPASKAPWAQAGEILADAPNDLHGRPRKDPTALGPLER